MSNDESQQQDIILKGVAASPGVAHCNVFLYRQAELEIPNYEVDASVRDQEISRFENALMETRRQINGIRAEVARKLGEEEAIIFDAHLLVLEDVALIDETIREQQDSNKNIERCFYNVSQRYIEAFGMMDDEYIKERITDIRDVAKRVLTVLMGHQSNPLAQIDHECILVAENITPSDAAAVEKQFVKGIVTDSGSRTSHAVIMARSLQVPAVVGLHDVASRVKKGDSILVDGYDGVVIINPSQQTLYSYGQYQKERQSIQRVFDSSRDKESKTVDGHPVSLMVNIGSLSDLDPVLNSGAEGVGLFRTEGLFVGKDRFPEEEEQYQVYRQVAESMGHRPVIIRTLDIGGDKHMGDSMQSPREDNPFLGLRAIRFCLEHPDLFLDQLRAILRAAVHGNIKMMYPMISGVDEIKAAHALLDKAKEQLRERGVSYKHDIEVGAMIEVPSAAATVDLLANHCGFFSIGTNDLIQYTMAVDRINDRIAHLYQPCHAAVLRMIKQTCDVARERGLHVGVCGEMASEAVYTPLLVGLGVTELSMSTVNLAEARFLIRRINYKDAKEFADNALNSESPSEVHKDCKEYYTRLLSDVLEMPK